MPDIFVADPNKVRQRNQPEQKAEPLVESKEAEKIVIDTAQEEKLQDVKRPVGFFHSFCIDPTGVLFANQDSDEKVLLFLRAHLITNLPWIARTVVLLLLPVLINFATSFFGIEFNIVPQGYSLFILIFYFYAVLLFAFIDFVSWFYNIGLVTNVRVYDVDLKNMVYTHVAATKLAQIEDVSYKRTGAVRSIFDYGDVAIQTAAETENFEFLAVPKPNQAVNVVEDLIRGEEE
jgi:hypothetical protein